MRKRKMKTGDAAWGTRLFTIIELLVVIAIITILASLLFPALMTAKNMAKRALCSSNLKQIGLAIQSYTYDNDGYFPHQKLDYTNSSGSADTHRWQSYIQNYLGIDGPSYYLSSAPRNCIFYCPCAEANNSAWYSYQINRSVCPSLNTRTGTPVFSTFGAFSPRKIKKPSKTLLVTDGLPGQEFIDSLRLSDPNLSNHTVSYRHENGAIVLFVDGHAQWMRPTLVPAFPLAGFIVLDVAFQNTAFPGKPLYE